MKALDVLAPPTRVNVFNIECARQGMYICIHTYLIYTHADMNTDVRRGVEVYMYKVCELEQQQHA